MAVKANRVYERCQQYLEEAKGMTEKALIKRAKIKPIQIGDKVYICRVPTAGIPSKLQPAYTGPFGVVEKMSDVVIRLGNNRTGNTKTLHTYRVKIILFMKTMLHHK